MNHKNICFLIFIFAFFLAGCSYNNDEIVDTNKDFLAISKEDLFKQETSKPSLFDELSHQAYSRTKKDRINKRLFDVYSQWKGTKYMFGGTTKRGIDCSGFVQKVLLQGFGLYIPRDTISLSKMGTPIKKNELRTGDLVFFRTTTAHHVGIYIDDGKFMHASSVVGVTISKLDNAYYKSKYWKAQRIFN